RGPARDALGDGPRRGAPARARPLPARLPDLRAARPGPDRAAPGDRGALSREIGPPRRRRTRRPEPYPLTALAAAAAAYPCPDRGPPCRNPVVRLPVRGITW